MANRKAQILNKKKAGMSVNSDTGGAESPLKGDDSKAKKQRHRISFADEVTADKSALSDVHYIESYKKYN